MITLRHNSFGFYLLMFMIMIFTSCEIQKRHYRSGYAVCYPKKTQRLIENDKVNRTYSDLYVSTQNNDYRESLGKEVSELANYLIKDSLPNDSCGDIILLNNYAELKVRIISISDSIIEYKSCSNLNGNADQMLVKNIKMIKYNEGKTVYYDKEFEKVIMSPGCEDEIVLNNNSSLKGKILTDDPRELKYIDCGSPGEIKNALKNDVKQIIYKDTSKNIESEGVLNKKLNNHIKLSALALLFALFTGISFATNGGGGITPLFMIISIVLYAMAMYKSWKLYQKIENSTYKKLYKRSKLSLMLAFLPAELMVLGMVIVFFVLLFAMIIYGGEF